MPPPLSRRGGAAAPAPVPAEESNHRRRSRDDSGGVLGNLPDPSTMSANELMGINRPDLIPEPLSKRQKRGGSDEKRGGGGRVLVLGGPMYDEATARKMLKEVLLASVEAVQRFGFLFNNAESNEAAVANWLNNAEDDEAVIGFDPNDAALDNIYYAFNSYFWEAEITPMIYYAYVGNLKMCRYLASRGASTTKSTSSWGPMRAAIHMGHLEVCKFLYANGASHDIWKETSFGVTPLHSVAFSGRDELVRWLVLQGALCADGSSEEIERDRDHLIYPEICFDRNKSELKLSSSYERLVGWAKEVTESHSSLKMFLLGALPPAPDKDQRCALLQCLSGHPGVREHIGNFVGLEVTKTKQLRFLRNVVDVLPSLIKR